MHQCSLVLQDKEGELLKATGLRPGAANQKWVSAANLTSLLQEVRRAKASGQSVRLVGGNTGPGVYKDWPVDIDVLISTTGAPELINITSRQVHAIRRLVNLPCLSRIASQGILCFVESHLAPLLPDIWAAKRCLLAGAAWSRH